MWGGELMATQTWDSGLSREGAKGSHSAEKPEPIRETPGTLHTLCIAEFLTQNSLYQKLLFLNKTKVTEGSYAQLSAGGMEAQESIQFTLYV